MDTRNKRASAIGVGLPFRGIIPSPDGTIDQADRQITATLYSGILAGEIEVIQGSVIGWRATAERPHWRALAGKLHWRAKPQG